MDTAGIALSGIAAAGLRLRNAAHGIANWTTPGFHPLHTRQASAVGGGTRAFTVRSERPALVDLARERVEMLRAGRPIRASLRVLETDFRTRGALLDLRV
jgi:hypothetical protein